MVYIRSRNRNRNPNLSKVGTGTVINSYGSATLPVDLLTFNVCVAELVVSFNPYNL